MIQGTEVPGLTLIDYASALLGRISETAIGITLPHREYVMCHASQLRWFQLLRTAYTVRQLQPTMEAPEAYHLRPLRPKCY
jgi:hypothetical protein